MRIRDGPAAVRGVALPPRPLASGLGRWRRGEPRVRRPSAPPQIPNPSRKEDSCFDDSSSSRQPSRSSRRSQRPALAERVKVRVEGKTTTIFGSTEPTLTTGPNALAVLDAASLVGEFYYHVSPGPSSTRSGAFPASASAAGATRSTASPRRSPPTRPRSRTGTRCSGTGRRSASRAARRRCSSGVAPRPTATRWSPRTTRGRRRLRPGAVLNVDGRRVKTRSGRACVGRHRGLVRATAPNAVRSNALR